MSIAQKHFSVGYELYVAGQPFSSCQNEHQRRGWLSANRTEGEFVTPHYADKVGW